METPLFLPPYSALESHQPCLGIEGGGGTDRVDAESRSEVDCLEELCYQRTILFKHHSLHTVNEANFLVERSVEVLFLLFVFVVLEVKQSLVHAWEVLYH